MNNMFSLNLVILSSTNQAYHNKRGKRLRVVVVDILYNLQAVKYFKWAYAKYPVFLFPRTKTRNK